MDGESDISYSVESAHKTVHEITEALTSELGKRGFGVLSTINVKKIIKEKLGENLVEYVILDVCSPKEAKKAIDAHREVGLVLPCKIVVYEGDGGKTKVSLYKPKEAIKVLGFTDLNPLAERVEEVLKSAVDAVGS